MEYKTANFQLVSIQLKEVNFFREEVVPIHPEKDYDNKLNIELKRTSEEDNVIKLNFTVEFSRKYKENLLVRAKISHVGIFKHDKDVTKDQLDNFVTVNAPAIIFPFTREELANLSIKAFLPPILLQTMNFSKFLKTQTTESESEKE